MISTYRLLRTHECLNPSVGIGLIDSCIISIVYLHLLRKGWLCALGPFNQRWFVRFISIPRDMGRSTILTTPIFPSVNRLRKTFYVPVHFLIVPSSENSPSLLSSSNASSRSSVSRSAMCKSLSSRASA